MDHMQRVWEDVWTQPAEASHLPDAIPFLDHRILGLCAQGHECAAAPARASVSDVRNAARRFKKRTALGSDTVHPRDLALVCDEAFETLCAIWQWSEAIGRIPVQLALMFTALLPKPDGGFRPIGLLPGICRVFGKVTRREAVAWERSQKKDAPLRLRLLLAMYQAPKLLQMGQVMPGIIYAGQGIIAGCAFATSLMKLILLTPVDAMIIHWPSTRVFNVVGDITLFAACAIAHLGRRLGTAAQYLLSQLQALHLVISRDKGVVMATHAEVGREKESFLSEHATGGRVAWRQVEAQAADGGYQQVDLPHGHVPFQSLMQGPPAGSPQDVLYAQYWAVGTLRVEAPGRFAVDCSGLHTFQDRGATVATPVSLPEAGLYRLLARVRGKVPLRFACALKPVPADADVTATISQKGLPDVVLGRLIAARSALNLRVRNLGAAWAEVVAEVRQAGQGAPDLRVHGARAVARLAPGALAQLPVELNVTGPPEDREGAACARFEVAVALEGAGAAREVVLPVALRCRRASQSAMLSFLDADGSVGSAAVLRPRGSGGAGSVPTVVSLSGVGVEPQGQADAYKMKPSPTHPGDFVFGFEGLWVMSGAGRGGPGQGCPQSCQGGTEADPRLQAEPERRRHGPGALLPTPDGSTGAGRPAQLGGQMEE
ncbi:unnamed protein product [Prorocentrum cordatum]|uniref:Uncharacterized protein n=1 Tax=Prorocentrum cordatum TaxID=2364126 RepID=A0ABN9WAX8_9DINO|nr:unnamed protein product [Polarella glacialis]